MSWQVRSPSAPGPQIQIQKFTYIPTDLLTEEGDRDTWVSKNIMSQHCSSHVWAVRLKHELVLREFQVTAALRECTLGSGVPNGWAETVARALLTSDATIKQWVIYLCSIKFLPMSIVALNLPIRTLFLKGSDLSWAGFAWPGVSQRSGSKDDRPSSVPPWCRQKTMKL